jgi:hypothetical protein
MSKISCVFKRDFRLDLKSCEQKKLLGDRDFLICVRKVIKAHYVKIYEKQLT